MRRRITQTLPAILLTTICGLSASAFENSSTVARKQHQALFSILDNTSDRERDGLVGPVRRVKTETVKLTNKGGKMVEGQRAVLESVAYDIKGVKIENAYFPVPGSSLTGKEVYKYDDKGNIVEMTLLNADGSLLSKETYTYEFDGFGNWTKMTTSVAVIEGGKITFEPTEITYRTISYYLDGATLAKMTQAATPAPLSAVPTVAATSPSSGTQNSVQSKPVSSAAQPASAAASKANVPLPSGAALVKTNMANAGSALAMTGGGNVSSAVLKVEDAPPPPVVVRAPKPLLKPVSGGVLNGKAVSLPVPAYPPAARSMRASGKVTVEVVIDEAGKVISAKALNGQPLLQQAAVQAAKEARFSPTLLSGQPVKISGQIYYNFNLTQ